MACAHAKFTGEVGVCLATSGPGAIHLLNGLYDARLDHQPVVAIVGQQALAALGGSYQQEVDLVSLFKDVAGEYVHMASTPEQVRHLVDRAVRIAQAERTVTCIILAERRAGDGRGREAAARARDHSLRPRLFGAAASSRRKRTCAGRQMPSMPARRSPFWSAPARCKATDEVLEVADLLGAGIAKALLGKAAVPDDLPYVTGSIGLLGTRPSYDMMMECDTLLMIGSRFPYSEFLPKEGQARGVQIDLDGTMLSIRYPMEVNLQGDSAATLRALIPLLERKTDRSWREEIEKGVAHWWKVLEGRAMSTANPLNPQRLFLGAVAATCRIIASCPRTRAPRQTGTHATSRSAAE